MNKPRLFVNIGDTFGDLTVIGEVVTKNKARYVCCQCSCGVKKLFTIANLVHGKSKSCGCIARKLTSQRETTHGLAWAKNGKMRPLYGVWLAMKGRCHNPLNRSYHRYGGRGITVCKEWKGSYMAFHKWATTGGYAPGLTIERKDNDGGYSPENCTFTGRKQQANNTRNNRLITINGETKTLAQWANSIGVGPSTVAARIKNGWPIEKAVATPKLKKWSRHNANF